MLIHRTHEEREAMDRFAGVALAYLLPETQLGGMVAKESLLSAKVMASYAERAYDMAEAMLDARGDRGMRHVEG